MTIKAAALALLTVAFVVGTVMFGWWTAPVLGLVWGVFWESPMRSGGTAAISAMAAWSLLLGWTATQGPVGVLSVKVAGVMGIPTVGLYAVTVLLAGLLAGSGAAFSGSIRGLPGAKRSGRRD
jgi:hypothetical protein